MANTSESVLFRSEKMAQCQLFLQPEAAYNCVAALGELGLVQFVDLNPGTSSFQRKFVAEVKRCDEVDRKLSYISQTVDMHNVIDTSVCYEAPNWREFADIESAVDHLERDLREVESNFASMRQNQLELTMMRQVLLEADTTLLRDSQQYIHRDDQSLWADNTDVSFTDGSDNAQSVAFGFELIAGTIDTHRSSSFERVLWRFCRGNVFIRFHDSGQAQLTGLGRNYGVKRRKSVFFIFFQQGDQLSSRIKKVCEGYHATIYQCPSNAVARQELLNSVETRLDDLKTVLSQTEDHKQRLVSCANRLLPIWIVRCRKMAAIYDCMNKFAVNEPSGTSTVELGQSVLQPTLSASSGSSLMMVGECWIPESDLQIVQAALNKAAAVAGSSIPPIVNVVTDSGKIPPTFNRTNKVTCGFQDLVDAYGVNTYREANPAVYTIATFPFLFAVMFGDAGHGLMLLIAASFLIKFESRLTQLAAKSEVFAIFFGGRYIIWLMGLLSIFTGLIYNDIFAKSFNIFGSRFLAESFQLNLSELESKVTLDPGNSDQYYGTPYLFGVDPVWQMASNKILYLNSFKMKISLIFGVLHMTFGLLISLWNRRLRNDVAGIWLEFVPQIVFLTFLFGYLVIMMFMKWTLYSAVSADASGEDRSWSEHCAPSILITFINMMLFKSPVDDPRDASCRGHNLFMFFGQQFIQKCLIVTALAMVPIMLFGKPLAIWWARRNAVPAQYLTVSEHTTFHDESSTSLASENSHVDGRPGQVMSTGNKATSEGEHESGNDSSFGDLMIYQAIHTIEYVLSCVSHTASYLRLWALSLAHSQLSEVLWNFVMKIPMTMVWNQGGDAGFNFTASVAVFIIFAVWATMTVAILVVMEGLSAFLHTLRLHWVEFQSKFYDGSGYLFQPFRF